MITSHSSSLDGLSRRPFNDVPFLLRSIFAFSCSFFFLPPSPLATVPSVGSLLCSLHRICIAYRPGFLFMIQPHPIHGLPGLPLPAPFLALPISSYLRLPFFFCSQALHSSVEAGRLIVVRGTFSLLLCFSSLFQRAPFVLATFLPQRSLPFFSRVTSRLSSMPVESDVNDSCPNLVLASFLRNPPFFCVRGPADRVFSPPFADIDLLLPLPGLHFVG